MSPDREMDSDEPIGRIVAIHPIAGRHDGAFLSKKAWEVAKGMFGLLNWTHGNPAGWRWEFVANDGTVIDTASPGRSEYRVSIGYYTEGYPPMFSPAVFRRRRVF